MVDTDTILMYLLQCRADDFITVFEKLYNIPQEAMRTEMQECVKYFGMSSENCLDCSLALTKAIEGKIDSYKGLVTRLLALRHSFGKQDSTFRRYVDG